MRKQYLLYILSLVILMCPTVAEAQLFKKKKKPEKVEKKKSDYERILTDKSCETSKGGLLTLHKTDGKLYVEFPVSTLGKEVLIGATLSGMSNPNLGTIGFKPDQPKMFKIVKVGNTLVLQWLNLGVHSLSGQLDTPDEALEVNYRNPDIASFKIEAFSKDSTSFLVNMTSFFSESNKLLKLLDDKFGGLKASVTPKSDLTNIKEIKAYKTNARIVVENSRVMKLTSPSGAVVRENYPATYQVTYSILQLPEKKMVPRLADTRVGIFQTRHYITNPESGKFENISLANRWRLEPKDTLAYLRGELTEVIKPIVFYIDDAFPKEWMQPIYRAVLNWNSAFEKIGFKNVMQVRDFPKNDPNFDPNDLQYSCIRYVPTPMENAFGPSWVDIRTGEIINASVHIYANVAKLINTWRFVQTAQVDESVRSGKLPKAVFDEALMYVVSHEVGHTLGFMHNMAASSAFPVDSLRSVSFTQKYGTTPSIMDYARFNYVAQPEDKGVKLTPPDLGVFDDFLIEWNYRAYPKSKGNPLAEAALLDSLVESHAKDSLYRYVMQQFSNRRYDPSAIEEDLGDDPMKAGDYGLKNLRYISFHLDEWVKDDSDGEVRKQFYNELALQAYRYMNNVSMMIGGIYIHPSSEKSGILRYRVVNKEKQREATKWLLRKAREFASIANPSLEAKLDKSNRPFELYADVVRQLALGRIFNVSMTAYLDSTSYQPLECLDDIYKDIFVQTLRGEERLSAEDMALQKVFVGMLGRGVSAAIKPGAQFLTAPTIVADEWKHYLDEQICADHCHTSVHLYANTEKHPYAPISFGDGYGENGDMWMTSVDATQSNLYYYGQKAKDLLESVVGKIENKDLKLHYNYLLRLLKKADKD